MQHGANLKRVSGVCKNGGTVLKHGKKDKRSK